MFSTQFSGGYDAYSARENRVDTANRARQKSQRISQAVGGKPRKRKAKSKGKQFAKQPKNVAKKVKQYRRVT